MPKIVDADDRRADLAAAAARLIATVGLENVRLKDVAAEAGWTTGALTHYFPDKRSLLVMAMTTSLDRIQGRKHIALGSNGDEFRWLLEQALPLDEERIQHWRVSQTFFVWSWTDPELNEIKLKAFRRWRRRLVALLAEGQRSGRFLPDLDPEEAVDETIAIVDGVATQALLDPERWPPERQLAFLERHLARISTHAGLVAVAQPEPQRRRGQRRPGADDQRRDDKASGAASQAHGAAGPAGAPNPRPGPVPVGPGPGHRDVSSGGVRRRSRR